MVSWVGKTEEAGVNGPALIAPVAVATKKLTTEPWVKFRPLMTKLAPTGIIAGEVLLINGWPATGVAVGMGVGVPVGSSTGVGVAVKLLGWSLGGGFGLQCRLEYPSGFQWP